MADQYRCTTRRRLEETRKSALNGIDYLEVLDNDAPPGIAQQRTLLVRCLKPVTLATHNVAIEGGVRIAPVHVVWAAPATAVPVAAEQAFFSALPAADHVLVVRTDTAGDFSTYVLRLHAAPSDPSFDFDPQLTEIEFSFKAECPSKFDCEVDDACVPPRPPEPVIDYLAKDYATFRRLLLDRLSVLMPEWRERHAADEGMALVELLAYRGDYLSYQQDAVATEAYLGTARRRVSVRRHVRLLDYRLHDGCNARAWVVFEVEAGGGADGLLLPARRELLTQSGTPRGLLAPAARDTALRRGAKVFETLYPITLRAARNELRFYTWSDERCCLPKGATRATLRDLDGAALAVGEVLVFEELLGPASGLKVDADPAHRHVVRLTRADPDTDPLTTTKVVHVEWDDADALPFPLCLSTVVAAETGDMLVSDVSVARGNVVLADHGRAIAGEELDPALVPLQGRYRPRLPDPGLTFRVPYDPSVPAVHAAVQDPREAEPWLELDDGGAPWKPRPDVLGSDRFQREFVVEVESDGFATLRFGDGILGRAPERGTKLLATYRVGNGRQGNVGAEAIANVVLAGAGITDVRNPLPAAGGSEPETIEQAQLYAPQAFRTQRRAVTEKDWAAAAESFEDVQHAVATRRWTGSWQTIFITVDRFGARKVDAGFEAKLRAYLERFRLAGYDLEIDGPRFVPLDVAMTVCVTPGYFRSDVEQELLRVLGARDLADGRRGFFHADNFSFGEPVYLSRLTAAAMSVPGVASVDFGDTPPKKNRFKRYGRAAQGELAAGRIALGRLEVARLDNDPNEPENGRLELSMAGGL